MGDRIVCLEFKDISMEFPGVKALSNVNMEIKKGEIHALMGANGAGKSTLIKILARVHQQSSGDVFLNGNSIDKATPQTIRNYGIDFIFQELELVPGFTVAQNIMIGIEPEKKGIVNWKEMEQESQKALDAFIPGVVDAKLRIADLSVAKQQIVCIVRALYRNPKILVFDEPTSRLSAPETEALFSAINKMRKERELTIIYISHRLEELFRICDRVTILRDGICTGTWELSTLSKEDIVNKMVGTIQTTEKSTRQISPVNTSEPVLRIEGITIENLINNISFSVYPGEVISLFGAVGSRKTELLEAILGIRQYDSGKVFINGKETKLTGARSAKKHGICLIPEDRRKYGLIYDFTIRENITIAFLRHFLTLFGFIHKNNEIKNVKDICNTLQVKMPSTEVRVKTLSGGNQQKIVVAKWLLGNSEIYIFDEPTVGIDVRGKNEIHDIIHRLADEGKAVIMSSSEVDEAIKTGDRIVVLFNGQVAAQYNSADVNYEEIVYLSMGGKRNAV